MHSSYDVMIVGAGPSGLSAALVLGRCRRNVLICMVLAAMQRQTRCSLLTTYTRDIPYTINNPAPQVHFDITAGPSELGLHDTIWNANQREKYAPTFCLACQLAREAFNSSVAETVAFFESSCGCALDFRNCKTSLS